MLYMDIPKGIELYIYTFIHRVILSLSARLIYLDAFDFQLTRFSEFYYSRVLYMKKKNETLMMKFREVYTRE